MMGSDLVLVAAAAFGVGFMAGSLVTVGLYLGERGRRIDAQRREGVLPFPDSRPSPVTRSPYEPKNTGDAELADVPPTFLREMLDEGFSTEQAEEEWRTLLARGLGDRAQGWIQES
jgi:hypothetical protein